MNQCLFLQTLSQCEQLFLQFYQRHLHFEVCLFGLPGVAPKDVALWFGVVYMVNMQMSFISPPFGYALFYLKSVAPPEVTMAQIFRSSFPFLALQAVGLTICILFPEVVLWLPRMVYGG